jgi:hypothetical protein
VLREGRVVVSYGVSEDPDARLAEHQRNHPRVTMTVEGPAVTREAALAWERTRIEQYCQAHGGKKPKYNKV